jgi:hypothetical protein
VLPAGIVCEKCNNYFGTKVEPVLLRDPISHTRAVLLRLRDPDNMNELRDSVFDAEHPCVGSPERKLSVLATISPRNLTLDLQYTVEGQLSKSYKPGELAFLSRAVHKRAFESLASMVFVEGRYRNIDILDGRFDAIRQWSRYGQSQNHVGPVLRLQRFEEVSREEKPQ